MDSELDRLHAELSEGKLSDLDTKLLSGVFDKKSKNRGIKKRYFKSRADLIFKLVECYSASYNQILAALAKDGVDFNYGYFRELMAAEKKRRHELGHKENQSVSRKPSDTTPPTPALAKTTSNTGMTPERAAFKAENERIKALNISNDQKRLLLAKAAEDFSNTQNPLNRK